MASSIHWSQRLWLAKVEEARPLLAAPLVERIAYGGLMIVGLVALALTVAWRRGGGWCDARSPISSSALAIALAQIRGVYVGAALAAVPIAVLLAEARARGARCCAVVALWIAGAGLLT